LSEGPATRIRFAHRLEAAAVHALASLAAVLPRGAAFALGRLLGAGALGLGIRAGVARANLARAFPEKPVQEREAILRATYAQAGMAAIELLRADRLDAAGRAAIRARMRGLEHLAAARARGKGVLLMSGHFGAFELFGAAQVDGPTQVHYFARAQSNPLVDRLVVARRRALASSVLHHGRRGVRQALDLLHAGHCVVILADQDAGRDGVFVDFFGVPTSTPAGPAEFALRTGAAIVFGVLVRSEAGTYEGEILPPLDTAATGDHAADVRALTQRHTAALERFVRAHPEQWLWTHRRWKTPPPASLAAFLLACALAAPPAFAAPAPAPSPVESTAAARPAPESVFDGAGSSLFPLEPARVRRLFEEIRVRRLADGWAVESIEWFAAGVAPATAIMGLPDYRASLARGAPDSLARAGHPGTLRELEVTVDGLPMAIEALPGSAAPGQDLGGIERIFRFAVPFSAEETRAVRLAYRFGESRTQDDEPLLFFYRNPGSLWEGESPKSTISIDLGDASAEDIVVGWLRPLGYRLYGSRIVWHRPAGEELADIALGLRAAGDPLAAFPDRQKGPLALALDVREEWFERLTVRDLRYFIAWLLVRRGGAVPADGPGAALAGERWVRPPVRGFRESRLSADERRLLVRLRERLAAWELRRIPFFAGPPFVPGG
jgi:KDO2-lipid IV(A) lauroyltransferase